MTSLAKRARARLLETLSGDPNGSPEWVARIAEGEDAGFFGVGSATWAVHGGMATLVAGVRALLMQALHPGAMAGVHDWSRYREDPLGRLAGTIRWVMTVTFGDTVLARDESDRVNGYHRRVQGIYTDSFGREIAYSASDPELKRWVHVVFTDAFLSCHEIWGDQIPGGPDQYVNEWSAAGEIMGVRDIPQTAVQLRAAIDKLADEGVLLYDERVRETVRFLRRPPLNRTVLLFYRIFFAAAVASLPKRYRKMLRLRRTPLPVITMTSVLLKVTRKILGPSSTSERAARGRINQLHSA